jgi:hypothetical protein
VQPWAAKETFLPAAHPLTFLKQTWDGDKHHEPMRVEWGTNFAAGSTLLGGVTMTMARNLAEQWERSKTPDEVDRSLHVTVGVVRDGDVLVRVHLPYGVQDVTVGSADRSFALVAVAEGVSKPDPLFPQLMNLMRFAGEVVDYVTGAVDGRPAAWAPGEGIVLPTSPFQARPQRGGP